MPVTPEATEYVDRLVQHIKEVEAGLIPADSPVDFIRSDWQPDENGKPGWFGPDWKPDERPSTRRWTTSGNSAPVR